MQPQPDPIFGASTPIPGDDVKGTKGNMSQGAMPSSPLFWGRKYVPPTPLEVAAIQRGPIPFPKMMYHPDGRIQPAANEEDHKAAVENGWQDTPDLIHRELLQMGDNGKSGKRLPTAGSDAVIEQGEEVEAPKSWKAKEKAK